MIFNSATGDLFYDQDGTGSRPMMQLARITGLAGTLTYENFVVV